MINVKIVSVTGQVKEGKLDHVTGLVYISNGVGFFVETVHNLISNQKEVIADEMPEETELLNFNHQV